MSDYVRNEFRFTFDLIHLRTECPVFQKCLCGDQPGAQYMPKPFIFEIPRDQIPNPPHGLSWAPQGEVHNVRLDPPVDSICKHLQAYSTDGLENSNGSSILVLVSRLV